MTISLPYPPSLLNPNVKAKHWSIKWNAAKTYKQMCTAMLREHKPYIAGLSMFSITFRPPNANRRDLDNAIASLKSGLDALSAATGIDDSKFQLTFKMGEPLKGGAVEIEAMAAMA
jgi:crossover junction endodeoxyribonuclease RusA